MKRFLAAVLCAVILLTTLSAGGLSVAAASDEPTEKPEFPHVTIVTDSGEGLKLQKEDGYVGATVTVTDTDGATLGGQASVKIRGNSTSRLNKKSYTFKFDSKQNVLGMGKAKKWALVASMFDPTLLRNYVGIHTAAELGLDFTSQQRIVEVWVDGSYRGCYSLLEPIQEGKERVDIDIESNDGMNDFMIERERNRVEADATYFTTNGIRFVCSEPEEPSEEQLAYIQSTMDDIVNRLKSGDRDRIEEKVDLESFAKYYLLNEFVKTVDFDYSSVFFYYKGGKLYAGPAWDYDLSMGNMDTNASAAYAEAAKTDGLYCNTMHFYKWLCQYDWFTDRVKTVYRDHADCFHDIGAQGGMIDRLYQEHKGAIDRNFTTAGWRFTHYANLNKQPFSTYDENLAFFKSWCADRAAWLEETFGEPEEYLVGDANGDGRVDILDATAIQRKLAVYTVASFDAEAADADEDGSVTVYDVTMIRLYLAAFPLDTAVNTIKTRKA
ncbi:MAG: CotH kinase family protein [Ruminococcus sp.]|nr:CotH kinase family protein [Ruminococcus sp.]